jgi:tape measure domain-containing protein
MAEVQGLLIRLEATTALLRSEMQRAESQVNASAASIERNARRAEQAVNAIGGGLKGALAGLSVGAVVSDIVKTTFQFEKLDARLKNLSTTEGAYADNQRFISKTAQDLGVDLVTLSNSYTGLLSAQKEGKISGEQGRAILIGMADAAATLGISNEQLKLSFFGLNQVLGSATVTMEDVRQVTDPIPGLFDKIAKAGGRSSQELRKLIADGQVTSDVFGKLLVKALGDYEGASAKMADGLNGSWTRLQNAWTELKRTLEEPITDVLLPLMQNAKAAVDYYNMGIQGFKPMEERGVPRLKFDLDVAQKGLDRARAAGEPTTQLEKLVGQIQARLAFLEGPPEGSGPAPAPAPAPPPLPPPKPKKEPKVAKTDAQRAEEKAQKSIADLKFEAEQLARTADEQELYNALKAAGVERTSAHGQAIEAYVSKIQGEKKARELLKEDLEEENKKREEGKRIYEAVRTPVQEYADRIAELRDHLAAGTITQGTFNQAVGEAKDKLKLAQDKVRDMDVNFKYLQEAGSRAFERIGSGITEAFVSGEGAAVSFKNVAMGVISEILQSFIELAAVNPLKNLIFGTANATLNSVGGNLAGRLAGTMGTDPSGTFGGTGNGFNMRAAGGPVSAGQSYVVGERRPEIFTPDVNGRIVPRVPAVAGISRGGAGPSYAITQHLNFATGIQSTVRAEVMNMMPTISNTARAGIMEAQARRGRSM